MKRIFGVVVVLVALAGTNVLGGDNKKAKAAIQGKWEVTEFEFGGMKKPFPGGGLAFIFAGDKVTMKGGPKGDAEGTYKIDASQKPAHIDLALKKGEKEETLRTIYEVTGDAMKLAFPAGGGKDRPKSFEDKGIVIMHMKKK